MSRKQITDLDFGGVSRVRNLPAPVNADEPARLADLNAAVEGISWKDSVRVASQVDINLASPGTSIDGVTLAAGDRVLVKAQNTASENGIYVYNGDASALTRAPDASTSVELESAVTMVEEGSSAGASFRQTSVNFTLETGDVVFTQFGQAAGAATETSSGIIEIATQSEVDTGTDDQRAITPLKLASWSGKTKRANGTIGDGSQTQFDVSHNFNTRDVIVQVYENSGSYAQVNCDISFPTVNTARLNFAAAPATNSLRVVVMG